MNDKPIIFGEGFYTKADIQKLEESFRIWMIFDIYKSQLEEFFKISHPNLQQPDFKRQIISFFKKRNRENCGNWVYYPWNGNLVHMVNEDEYTQLRTNRNRNLITEAEQKELYNSSIGIVGLSIGNSIALSLAYSGIGNKMKLAEKDSLETSNLNRIRARVSDIDRNKITITSHQIYELNPYAQLTLFSSGLGQESLKDFFAGSTSLSLVFDAIDDFLMKVKLRIEARKRKIPVIMLTNLGDSMLIDVERYDVEENLPLFNGLIGETADEILKKPITEEDKQKYAVQIVNVNNVPTRALGSLLEINHTLVGRPQLGNTVFAAGGIAAYVARLILLQKPLKSGRYRLLFEQLFNIEYDHHDGQNRTIFLKQIKEMLT